MPNDHSQTLQITVESTAGGFTTQATIYGAGIDFNDQTITNMWDTSGAYVDHLRTVKSSAGGKDHYDTVTTVLPYRVFGNSGTLRIQLDNNIQRMSGSSIGNPVSYFNVYASSEALPVNVFASADWNIVYSGNDSHKSGASFVDVEINHVKFHSAMSIAIEMWESELVYASVNPIYLNYNSASAVILATNAAVGTFNWNSIDGGIIG